MRSLIAISAAAAMLVAQMPLVPARAEISPPAPITGSANSVLAETFKAFPNGGDALSKKLTAAILANPKLAPDLVAYMRNAQGLNRAQKLAAEHALSTALEKLRIKAADYGIITKDTVPVVQDLWWIPLLALAIGGAACIAACGTTTTTTSSGTDH